MTNQLSGKIKVGYKEKGFGWTGYISASDGQRSWKVSCQSNAPHVQFLHDAIGPQSYCQETWVQGHFVFKGVVGDNPTFFYGLHPKNKIRCLNKGLPLFSSLCCCHQANCSKSLSLSVSLPLSATMCLIKKGKTMATLKDNTFISFLACCDSLLTN